MNEATLSYRGGIFSRWQDVENDWIERFIPIPKNLAKQIWENKSSAERKAIYEELYKQQHPDIELLTHNRY